MDQRQAHLLNLFKIMRIITETSLLAASLPRPVLFVSNKFSEFTLHAHTALDLKTGLTTQANGSAYIETGHCKIACAV